MQTSSERIIVKKNENMYTKDKINKKSNTIQKFLAYLQKNYARIILMKNITTLKIKIEGYFLIKFFS